MKTAPILLVDDREPNLVALEAILEPLGQEMVRATSGEQALRALLHREFAVILLDVQMPGMDGFETATLIKERERTRHIPILFLTALRRDAGQIFKGYTAGAVDYMLKPFDPEVLRAKVSVFIELWQKSQQILEQSEELRQRELAELERASEERYRTLAEAMPQIVWRADPSGRALYYNQRWFEYTGIVPAKGRPEDWQQLVHPDELTETLARFAAAAASGDVFEMEYRLHGADGTYRWFLGRAVPVRDAGGAIASWIGTATDIDVRRRAQESQRFLVEAGEILGASLDYRKTLAEVARAAVRDVADWCAVHTLEPDGSLRRLAVAHVDPAKAKLAEELEERYPPRADAPLGPAAVLISGEAELVPELSEELLRESAVDELHFELLRELGLRSYICVPLRVRDRGFGALTFVHAESGRAYGEDDLALAEELARRAATAIENSRLYREAEERAQAARVLANVGDGVVLVDRGGVVRLWNTAAAAITGVAESEAVGRRITDIVPAWDEIAPRIPIADAPGPSQAVTLPIEFDGREVWASGSGVSTDEGTVYAFRDLTEERALEAMKSDFVATVSHELRTPLAAIHGSALTILRPDLQLDDELHGRLLRIIAEESERLAQIVNDLLLASHLDSGRLQVRIESCNPREIAASVVRSAKTHLPAAFSLELAAPKRLPQVAADPGQLRQVLDNLVENAIKYSPDGGKIRVELAEQDGAVRFAVHDRGIGIPVGEQRRVFEKFYRVDPNMSSGVGGTGLGLYISRELVTRMNGRIWVEARPGKGSTFVVEIPRSRRPRTPRALPKRRAASAPR